MKNIFILALILHLPVLGFSIFTATVTGSTTTDFTLDFTISDPAANYPAGTTFGYVIKISNSINTWGASDSYLDPNNGPFYNSIFCPNGGVYEVEVTYFINNVQSNTTGLQSVVVKGVQGNIGCCSMDMQAESEQVLDNGYFAIDEATGKVIFKTNNDCFEPAGFNCISFMANRGTQNVISANAQTFNSTHKLDLWRHPVNLISPVNGNTIYPNAYETGSKNKWRVKETYTYKSELDEHIIGTSSANDYKNFDRGTFNYSQFLWRDISSNDFTQWIRTSDIISYSPNGSPTYEKNALNVVSAAAFGYNGTQTIAVAQNAAPHEIVFESFENRETMTWGGSSVQVFDNGFIESSNVHQCTTLAHSGENCLELEDQDFFNIGPEVSNGLWLNTGVLDVSGMLVQAWVKNTNDYEPAFKVQMRQGSLLQNWDFKIAQECGEWVLYEAEILAGNLGSFNEGRINFELKCSNEGVCGIVYIDDVRIQPLDAEMVTYVYDDQYRLVANFDSQHFGLFYQYNGEGKLIRKLKETTDGVVTLSETQYNSKGIQR